MYIIKGIGVAVAKFVGSVLSVTIASGGYININGKRIYVLSTAITANTTTTSAPAGSLAVTTNATGLSSIFRSDGTKWQYLTNS